MELKKMNYSEEFDKLYQGGAEVDLYLSLENESSYFGDLFPHKILEKYFKNEVFDFDRAVNFIQEQIRQYLRNGDNRFCYHNYKASKSERIFTAKLLTLSKLIEMEVGNFWYE